MTEAQVEANNFTTGSLYLIGFAQARSPHAGLIIPTSAASGCLVHIRIDRDTSPYWVYQCRRQPIAGDMFCTTLLKLRDIADGVITAEDLRAAAESVEVPQNDEFGECLPWVLRLVEKLGHEGRLNVRDVDALGKEFEEFAEGNKAFARRTVFPNVRASRFCS